MTDIFFPNFSYDWADRAPADMLYKPNVLASSYKSYNASLPWYPGKFLSQTTSQATSGVTEGISGAFDKMTNTLMTGMILFFGLMAGMVVLVFAGVITMNIIKKD